VFAEVPVNFWAADRPTWPIAGLEHSHFNRSIAGVACQAMRNGQPCDPAADDDYVGHAVSMT
jgi:hypothetical protein